MVHLHAHSYFSFLAGASSPAALAAQAATYDQQALALTDDYTLSGTAQHALACKELGIKPIHGTRVVIDDIGLVLLAADLEGYANICDLLTLAHHDRLHPSLTCNDLQQQSEAGKTGSIFCLVDMRSLIQSARYQVAVSCLGNLKKYFADRLFVELVHHWREGDDFLNIQLQRLAEYCNLKYVATNAVRHAKPGDFTLHDALVCAKQKITVATGHPERPANQAAYLCSHKYFEQTPIPQEAIANTVALARECNVDILSPAVMPPHATVPKGIQSQEYLRQLCEEGFRRRYPTGSAKAQKQMDTEFRTICNLELDEFFLVVAEIMRFARNRGIRCSGRGSAANSVIAYLLGITEVCPIKHGLLFERFLHEGRKGMPDIDVDFDSARRDEVISWMTLHWGEAHTAMTGTLYTFRLRSAVTEIAKVLGFPQHIIKRATKLVSPHCNALYVDEYRSELAEVFGDSPVLDVICQQVAKLHDYPRHLSLHNGGMILSRKPLRYLSPIRTSANGVRQIEFSKDDVERMGLIKFDVLGLRTLSVVSEAQSLIHFMEDTSESPERFDIDAIPDDDPETYELIRSTETLAVFQIESTGQQNLLARTQPKCFDDLVIQVAIFRPGPIQSGMVHPFIARLRGLAKTTYPHPSLEPVLKSTHGIILFQEQVLEVCNVFAGLSHAEADDFRRLMSKFRNRQEMEGMREQFVQSAMETHRNTPHPIHPWLANKVFDIVASYVGYGFCKSHSAAFARTVYQTAYLKAHYPAEYMAAVLQHQPGSFPLQTFLEEAQRMGITVLPVCLHRSDAKYSLESDLSHGLCIRLPFSAVDGITADTAGDIVFARALSPFTNVKDVVDRVSLPIDHWENLVRAGAFDSFGERREVLWQIRARVKEQNGYFRKRHNRQQLRLDMDALPPVPSMTPLEQYELLRWDFETTSLSTGPHVMSFYRTALDRLGVLPICELRHLPNGSRVRVAGTVIERRRPPTANDMTFLYMGDETGRLPTAIVPPVYERFKRTLREPALVVEGKIQTGGLLTDDRYRNLMIDKIWSVESVCQRLYISRDQELLSPHRTTPNSRVIGGVAGFPGETPRNGITRTAKAHTEFQRN